MRKDLKRVAHLAAHGAELSPGAHSVDERTGQSESTSGQEADRRQDAVFCPPCSILSGTQPLSGRWRMIPSFILSRHLHPLWSFFHCSRAPWAYLPPMPEGTAHEPGKSVGQKQPENPQDRRKPRPDEQGGPSFQARGTGACAGAACGVPLAGYAGPGDPDHLPAHAPDGIASSLRRAFRMLWPFPLSVRPPEHEPSFAAYLFLICSKASCPSRNSRVFLWKR